MIGALKHQTGLIEDQRTENSTINWIKETVNVLDSNSRDYGYMDISRIQKWAQTIRISRPGKKN